MHVALVAALLAVTLAQALKVFLYRVQFGSWDFSLVFSAGEMPSAHSAGVSALATTFLVLDGPASANFAISAVLAMIVMYDAAGVRRQAGEHAAILNRLIERLAQFFPEEERIDFLRLKERLGHRPVEVAAGLFLGVLVGLLLGASGLRAWP
ncbi:MAG: hypothetical protein BLITH_0294 [Brockia lithotrophica]|uniref:Divergent PAP2 family protein n=1 Tax=Brockia lithotrophica TaxID=933949 RepID=A0A2T5GAK3_9BACL|nr:divergent PAP2 family protein [Brockia lithotrophica]PTQ53214.1 MAG: hypothetical protein BLITH_0294 [Brockia lithotrophica]